MLPFPVSDFNFAMAGLATIAVTVGYSYAHKLAATTWVSSVQSCFAVPTVFKSNGIPGDGFAAVCTSERDEKHTSTDSAAPTSTEPHVEQATPANPEKRVITGLVTRKGSQKRKEPHDGFEYEDTPNLGYPHNLANIYPRKRCRTPTSHAKSAEDAVDAALTPAPEPPSDHPSPDDWVFVHSDTEPPRSPSPEEGIPVVPVLTAETIGSSAEENGLLVVERNHDDLSVTEGTKPSMNAQITGITSEHMKSDPVGPFLPKLEGNSLFKSPFLKTSSGKSSGLLSFKSGGFAAFAETKSSFNTSGVSETPNPKIARPIWSAQNESVDELQDVASRSTDKSDISSTVSEHAITQADPIAQNPVTCLTGEENEKVQKELKNVKLYVKRGDEPFTGGMIGHIKLLQDRNTHDERLLFRREPLWNVSMNVRINPSVRFTYDKNDHALRTIAQEVTSEATETGGKTPSLNIVVYALKPGRGCSKQDFEGFAESLVANSKPSNAKASPSS